MVKFLFTIGLPNRKNVIFKGRYITMNINTTSNLYASTPNYTSYAENAVQTNASDSIKKTAVATQERGTTNKTACQNAQDMPEKNGKTSLPASSLIEKLTQYAKVLEEHYAKVNKENKKFANPSKHIEDKYYNKKSPYYIKGLSDREREICYESEISVLNGGHAAVNSYDPVIQKTFGGGIMHDDEWQQNVRNEMNDSISQLFEENGIVIPDDADLMLRVDPYEYRIHATGVDPVLAEKIEQVLNSGENGKRLYEHLCWCDPANAGYKRPRQYLENMAVQEKAVMWHLINDLTGYDVRDLENRDGTIYTPDGQDLWDVMTKSFEKKQARGEMSGVSLQSFYKEYQLYVEQGWDKEDQRSLTVAYKNNALYDLDTEHGYGPGQNKWLQDLIEARQQYWKDYQANKMKEDFAGRKPSDFFAEDTSDNTTSIQTILSAIQAKVQTSTHSFLHPNNECINLFYHLIKNGRVISLSDKVLSLPQRKGSTGFDALA